MKYIVLRIVNSFNALDYIFPPLSILDVSTQIDIIILSAKFAENVINIFYKYDEYQHGNINISMMSRHTL